MKISELTANQSGVNLELEVIEVGEVKSFIRFGRVLRVSNAKVKDDSGEISLTLWNDEIEKVKPNTKVKITNGYVKEFQGELTVTAGKFGKIEVDGEIKADSDAEPVEEPKEPKAEEAESKSEETTEEKVEEQEEKVE